MLRLSVLSGVTCSFLFLACGKPDCKNSNKIFEDYSFDSKEYKSELIKQVQMVGVGNVDYWVDSYIEKDNGTYLTVDFIAEELCAKGMLLVTDWNKLKDIQRTRGMGYHGAKLVGLQFNMPNDSSGFDFVYRDVDYVRD